MSFQRPRLIAPPDPSKPSGPPQWFRSRRSIPEDVLRQASRRLGIMSLVAASMWIVATVLYHIVDRVIGADDTAWWAVQTSDTITAVAVVLSLALFVYSRRTHQNPRFVLDLGLVYMIVLSLLVGMIWHWDQPVMMPTVAPAITWIGVIILMFAATLPSSPLRILIAGTIAASMNPVGMLIAKARGMWDFGPTYNVLVMHYPDYMMVAIAAIVAHVLTGLGEEVARAREMGSYQLGELIGRGGMGEVYRATHRMLARPAAIKLIRPEMVAAGRSESADMILRRFRREAEVAASLRSPHTVELYDFGITGDGTLYFAMELLEGTDLESLVRQKGPLPAARVISILQQVCESLEEAHVRGLVHRDIKPANIHLGRVGLRHDVVKVLDFGLVKAVDADQSGSLETAAGLIPGTPAYIAPEVALAQPFDGRADLYALGAVAYFLLSGHLVFEGATSVQMLVRRLQEEPPSLASRTEVPVPRELERVVLWCLDRRPDERPQTAGELSRALADVPVTPWTEEQAREWWAANQLTHTRVSEETTTIATGRSTNEL
jgi:tRNA A-37 threonylcarbamoyl transferase component Bud32